MTLGNLIEFLEGLPPNKRIAHGFGAPHSFRGSYDEIAFEPVDNTTVVEMLLHAKSALNCFFPGYRGGEFFMHQETVCWISPYGESHNATSIGHTLQMYWTN